MTLIASDVESHLIRPGLTAPPLVCVSYAYRKDSNEPTTGLLNARYGADQIRVWLQDPNVILVLHGGTFDLAVLCEYDPTLIRLVFDAYKSGRIRDTKIREELLDIYLGRRQDNGATLVFRNGEWVKVDYKLSSLVLRYKGKDRSFEKSDPNGWRKRYAELEHLEVRDWPVGAQTYAIEDSVDSLDVYEAQWRSAGELGYLVPGRQDGTITNEIEQCQAAWALHLMSCWGIRTDATAVQDLEQRIDLAQEKVHKILKFAGVLKSKVCTAQEVREGKIDFYAEVYDKHGRVKGEKAFRWSTDKKRLSRYIELAYRNLGQDAPRTPPSSRAPLGQVATDRDTCIQSGSKFLKLYSDGGGISKIKTTYIPVLKQGTKYPINVRYNVLVNSGRTSAYGEKNKETGEVTGCNIQNLPTGRRVSGTRECFVPRPGRVFVSVDYNTIELRALAQVCIWLFGQSRMAEVINTGKDLHLAMAADILGITYEEIETTKKASDKGQTISVSIASKILKLSEEETQGLGHVRCAELVKKEIKTARDCAKIANFGLPGGLGAKSLVDFARTVYGVILTEEQARDLKNKWLATWPEMRLYFRYISDKVGFGTVAKLVQFVSNRVRGDVGFCDGCNTLFQGLVADGAKAALFQLAYEMYADLSSPLFGIRMVAFVHDEVIFEGPTETLTMWADHAAKVMCEAMRRYIPDVNVTAGPAAMARWEKNAEEVRGEDGRLILWVPKAA